MSGPRQPSIEPVHRLDTFHHGRITVAALRDYTVGVRLQTQDFGMVFTVDEAARFARALTNASLAASIGRLHNQEPSDLHAAYTAHPPNSNEVSK